MPREPNGQPLVGDRIVGGGRRASAERRADDESEVFVAHRRRRCHVRRDAGDEEFFHPGLDVELSTPSRAGRRRSDDVHIDNCRATRPSW